MSLSALETALTCPCRFYLNKLLGLEELPDLEPGLTALERGAVIHEVLHAFTTRFQVILQNDGYWDEQKAFRLLREVASERRPPDVADSHWQAEIARWLEGEQALLPKWLAQEKKRFLEGWRWLGMEESFAGLELCGWPTKIRGRLDRVDRHESGGLMIWDYKTGILFGKKNLIEDRDKFQLAGYLLAVQQGLIKAPPHPEARAGFIGLKSSRDEHLKFEDYDLSADQWREILKNKLLEVSRIGSLVAEGNFRPDPCQPPTAGKSSCQYCPFNLLCGYQGDLETEAVEDL
jgi:RecB family exonuclease